MGQSARIKKNGKSKGVAVRKPSKKGSARRK